MKYIDAERLKAHIQYLIKKDNYELFDVPELLSFIDSLQQEQPEVDVEKETDKLWESLNTGHPYVIVDSYQDFLGICLHCFELGLNARKEE